MNRLIAICIVALVFPSASLVLTCTAGTKSAGSPKTIRIIYTNDTIGYLEPCGCGGRYQGGLARRSTVIASLVKENPNTLIVDSGNLADKASKLPLVAKLMADMHYDATGIGEVDSGFANDFFKATSTYGLKVLDTASANSSSVAHYRIKKIGAIKVGVVSFGKTANGSGAKRSDTQQAFRDAYAKSRKQSDILILLDQGGIATKEWLEGEAVQIGAPDIVIGGVMNSVMPREQVIGKTHIVPTSVQGKLIGVIDVSFSQGQPQSLAARLVPVDREIPEDETVKKQIVDFLQRPRMLASFTPPRLNFGSIKKGTRKDEYVTLTPTGAGEFTISKVYSSGEHVSVPEWTSFPNGGGYRIRIKVDAGKTPSRIMETVSFKLALPDEPVLNLLVFGNVVAE
jgi:2',3'-cyclic-nucleotide 2'-phosphodiesterase (5'-nucleotidase family)